MLLCKRLRDDVILPTRAHSDDAGWDIYLCDDLVVMPGERVLVPTGLAMAIPFGHFGKIEAR